MEVKVCKNCRRLFNYINGPELCQECIKLIPNEEKRLTDKILAATLIPLVKEEEIVYEQVRDYIMTHPRATVIEIAETNKITPLKLMEWIRQERLEFSEDSKAVWFECEKCGAKINSGRLCNRCKIR